MRVDFSTEKKWFSDLWADIKAALHKDRDYVVVGSRHYESLIYDDLVSESNKAEQLVLKEITSMGFISFMETVGKDIEKGLAWIVKYAIPVETLVKLLFPGVVGEGVTIAFNAATLIQNAVLEVEQKYSQINTVGQTGAQKLADVLTLTETTVTQLLTQAGVTNVDTSYVTSLINAVVALLNVQATPAAMTLAQVPGTVVTVQDGVVKA